MDNDLKRLLSQLGDLKRTIDKLKKTLAGKTVRVTMNDDAIIVVINGLQQIQELRLNSKKLPWAKQDKVAQLVTRTVNEALKEAQDLAKEEIKKVTGGLNIPGLGGLF